MESQAQTYERFLVPAKFAPFAQPLIDAAAPRPGERVLDVACGTGIIARMIARQVPDIGAVTGLDLSDDMIRVAGATAEGEGLHITWQQGSADALPFNDRSFDVVVVQQGMQFFPDRDAAVREMYRVLAPGGRVGVSVWADLSFHPFVAAFADAVERTTGSSALRHPHSLGNVAELRAPFDAAGFVDVAVTSVGLITRYPSAKTYVTDYLNGVSAVLKEIRELPAAERQSRFDAIKRDLSSTVEQFTEGNEILSPMETRILVGWKPA